MSESKENTIGEEKELLKDIANISGKPGLYRILKPGRSGVIIESLDSRRERSLAAASSKVSILKDVSVYVEDEDEESEPLADIFLKIRSVFGDELPFDPKKCDEAELRDRFEKVLPDYHRSKVYASDIRKVFSWYLILSEHLPEFFEAKAVTEEAGASPESPDASDE